MASYWELHPTSSTLLLFLTFTIITLLLLKSLIRHILGSGARNLPRPPGPWRLPILGNLHQLIISRDVPHRQLRDLARRHGPDVMLLHLGEVPHLVVSSSKAAREVMKTHDVVFASRPLLVGAEIIMYAGSDLTFTPYGETFKHLRRLCMTEVLGPARVLYFRPIREAAMADLVLRLSREAAAGAVVDVGKAMYQLTGRVTCGTVLGKVNKELDGGALTMVEKASEAITGFNVSELFPSLKFLPAVTGYKAKLERLHVEMDALLDGVIKEHKERRVARVTAAGGGGGGVAEEEGGDHEHCREDLVDVLLNLQESGDLTMENIKAVTLDVFIGGVETSATLMSWTMAEMMKDERILSKAQEEVRQVYRGKQNVDESRLHKLEYLDLVIKEGLRLHPLLPLLIPRVNKERVEICGYEIPVGTRVIINGWAIGRDPHHWTEPDRFYPERFLESTVDYKGNNFEYIPFGAGRRMCPGLHFATIVVKLTLANLLYHFDWKLPDGMKAEDLDMTEALGMVVHRKSRLCLIPVAYDAMA